MSNTEDDIKQKRQAKKTWVPVNMHSKADFSENLRPGRSFPKGSVSSDLEICFHVDERPNYIEKALLVQNPCTC